MAGKLRAFGINDTLTDHRFVIRNSAGDTYDGSSYIAWNPANTDLYRPLSTLNGRLAGDNYFIADEPSGTDTYDLFFWTGNYATSYVVSSGTISYTFETPEPPPELYIPTPYVTVDSADAYFATKLYATAWNSATAENKQKALNEASRIINQFAYIGTKTEADQDNEFPRSGIVMDGVVLDETLIPQNILFATYEIAYALLRGVDPERELSATRVISRGFSSVRTTYDPTRIPEHILNGVPSSMAWLYLLPFLKRDRAGVIRIHRVN